MKRARLTASMRKSIARQVMMHINNTITTELNSPHFRQAMFSQARQGGLGIEPESAEKFGLKVFNKFASDLERMLNRFKDPVSGKSILLEDPPEL